MTASGWMSWSAAFIAKEDEKFGLGFALAKGLTACLSQWMLLGAPASATGAHGDTEVNYSAKLDRFILWFAASLNRK